MHKNTNMKHCAIIVLGDVGRSPRMLYHSLSCVDRFDDVHVHILGLKGTPASSDIVNHERISVHYLFPSSGPALIRLLLWSFSLLWTLLFKLPKLHFILVQTPPAVPTLPVVWFASRILRVPFLIDWHNLGYTLLRSKWKFLRNLYEWLEFSVGKHANGHFCVTMAMQTLLVKRLLLKDPPQVLYDLPNGVFGRTNEEEKKRMFAFGSEVDSVLRTSLHCDDEDMNVPCMLTDDAPLLVVCATSWTADEDMGLLLNAIQDFDNKVNNSVLKRRILFVITGRGPMRDMYEKKIESMNSSMTYCAVVTAFWSSDDYRLFLGCADAAISMHTSSSGIDLPMKIHDYLGSGLVIWSMSFPALEELEPAVRKATWGEKAKVVHKRDKWINSVVSGDELVNEWIRVLGPDEEANAFPTLHRMQDSVRRVFCEGKNRNLWGIEWKSVVAPKLSKILNKND